MQGVGEGWIFVVGGGVDVGLAAVIRSEYNHMYGCPGGPGLVLDAALGSADFFSRWGSWLSIVTVITGRQACIVYICSLCVQVTLINMRA